MSTITIFTATPSLGNERGSLPTRFTGSRLRTFRISPTRRRKPSLFKRRRGLSVLPRKNVLESRTVQTVSQTAASFSAGLNLYRVRLDKGYSLTDCISMETMRHEGITEVLTNDAHFEQEGFRALFREP